MKTFPEKTRDHYMYMARCARTAREHPDEFVTTFYRSVSYYVMRAQHYNRQVVVNKLWRAMR